MVLKKSCGEQKNKMNGTGCTMCTYLYLNEPWTFVEDFVIFGWKNHIKIIVAYIWNCKIVYYFRVYKLFFTCI